MLEHEHSLNLVDLWAEKLQHDEEYEEDEEVDDGLVAKQEFRCRCFACDEEISWYHRYYFMCCQCDYSFHKFCAKLPETIENICHVAHTLYLIQTELPYFSSVCGNCHQSIKSHKPFYHCRQCYIFFDTNCAARRLLKNIIYHPSHIHPLVCMTRQILCECDACRKEHKGMFYHCPTCASLFIHSDCAFLPNYLQIQRTTNCLFSHIHPLTLAYSFPAKQQAAKFLPVCRVCRKGFYIVNCWIYKCDKCRYYTHLDCATSRDEQVMSILKSSGKGIKNYEDAEHPDLLHLPFPDPSYNILKHLFFKKNGSTFQINDIVAKTHTDSHQHLLLILEDSDLASSIKESISYHDPSKRIELLCDGCLRPITSKPVYVCANEDEHCNFVLHEWCARLPLELEDHDHHQQHHTLVLHSKVPGGRFFGVYTCNICLLHCNGFVYYCDECKCHIDVNCAFLPKEITHSLHPNHLLKRVYRNVNNRFCSICGVNAWMDDTATFSCYSCKFHLHPNCALLIPETAMHMCDKHPMKLSYFPIEDHNSEYFCEICEDELNPQYPFYHCRECIRSIHPACATSILQYETYAFGFGFYNMIKGVHEFINVKFGGTYNNTKMHPHPLSFVQGIERDGECTNCRKTLEHQMIFRCLKCKFAVDISCCEHLSK